MKLLFLLLLCGMLLKRGMGNGEWGMGNGEWGMGNGEWRMGNGEWEIENGKWKAENGKLIFFTLTFYNVE